MRSAFSLVEIVIAIGILAVAVVGIMGLFPVAMRSAQDSQRETRAAQLARGIFDELQSLPGTNSALIRGPSITNAADRITGINLSVASTHVIGYDQQGNGLPVALTPAQFTNALGADGIFYVAKVEVAPQAPPSRLSVVTVDLEAPAATVSSNRNRYSFSTLMDQR